MRLFIFFALFSLLVKSTLYSEIKNITKNNKITLSQKIDELQKKFYKTKRGKREKDPVNLQEFHLILKIIHTKEEILNSLTDNYIASVKKVSNEISKRSNILSPSAKEKIYKNSSLRLGKTYNISDEIAKAKSFHEINDIFNSVFLQLTIYPTRLFLHLKFLSDINYIVEILSKENVNKDNLLKKYNDLQEEILTKIDRNYEIYSVQDVENIIKEEIEEFARMEIDFLNFGEGLKIKEENKIENEEIITYTILVEDKLILIYGKEEEIDRIKSKIETNSLTEFNNIIQYLKELNNIKFEVFEKEKEKSISYQTIRSVIFDDVIPIIEGLKIEEAKKLLSFFGYNVFINETLDKLRNAGRAVILTDTKPKDIIIIQE